MCIRDRRSFRARFGADYDRFADLHAVQLNDTHPTMAIPELSRLLMADGVTVNRAFRIAQRTFRYTNHTVMREALEVWDVSLLNDVSPALVRIVKRIQTRLAAELRKKGVEDTAALDIVRDGRVHMANLAVYGSSYTNGVAAIHTEILKREVFREWYALVPERFNNKTNGITQPVSYTHLDVYKRQRSYRARSAQSASSACCAKRTCKSTCCTAHGSPTSP